MTVRTDDDVIRLEGECWVEDAEPLADLLRAGGRTVDLSGCTRLHGAVAQALLAFAPSLEGAPRSEFLARHLAPAIRKAALRCLTTRQTTVGCYRKRQIRDPVPPEEFSE
jgi:hypothetical protein